MVTGSSIITLYIHGNNSLKGKRSVLKSIKNRAKNRFNIAISEVGEHDNHRKILIGISTVGGDKVHVEQTLAKAVNFIEDLQLAEFIDSKTEIY